MIQRMDQWALAEASRENLLWLPKIMRSNRITALLRLHMGIWNTMMIAHGTPAGCRR